MSARTTGAVPTSCARSTSSPTSSSSRTARCSGRRARRRVLCTATVQDGVPRWLYGSGRGWMTAEYSLLPASTGERTEREARARQAGRPHGRDPAPDRPRAARRRRLPGARRAHGLPRLRRPPGRRRHPLRRDLRRVRRGRAARSTASGSRRRSRHGRGRLGRRSSTASRCSTSTTSEDSTADVDMNVVMTGDGRLVEVQATAEQVPFVARAARRAARPRGGRDRARSGAQQDGGDASCCAESRLDWSRPRGSRSPRRSAGRSASSASCATARPASAPTCSSRRLGAVHDRLGLRLPRLPGERRRSRFDPTRIAAQIVTGIGFLGAGAIIRKGLSVRGLTTAATLWVAAAIGMAAGAGYYSGAVVTTRVGSFARAAALRRLRGDRPLRPEEGRISSSSKGQPVGPLLDS